MEIWIYTKDWTTWEIDGSLTLKRLELLSQPTAVLCLKDTKKRWNWDNKSPLTYGRK